MNERAYARIWPAIMVVFIHSKCSLCFTCLARACQGVLISCAKPTQLNVSLRALRQAMGTTLNESDDRSLHLLSSGSSSTSCKRHRCLTSAHITAFSQSRAGRRCDLSCRTSLLTRPAWPSKRRERRRDSMTSPLSGTTRLLRMISFQTSRATHAYTLS